jgi:hypothetical protein
MNKQKKELRRLIRDTILPPCSVSSLSFAEIRELSCRLADVIAKANAKAPQEVWILLGEVADTTGAEVIATFKHNPTKKEQKEALKKHILQAMSANDEIDLKAELARYTVAESGDMYVASSTTQP